MSDTQSRIVEMIAQLSLEERRELVAHIRQSGLLEESFLAGMTAEQRAQLDEGIAQADRGEVVDGNEAFQRLASRFHLKRA
jgi:predicted transcriptional regulator